LRVIKQKYKYTDKRHAAEVGRRQKLVDLLSNTSF